MSFVASTLAQSASNPRGRLQLMSGWGRRLGTAGPDEHWSCITCSTSFPVIADVIRCNGHIIDLCPWCRSDSAPWTNGRGL